MEPPPLRLVYERLFVGEGLCALPKSGIVNFIKAGHIRLSGDNIRRSDTPCLFRGGCIYVNIGSGIKRD